MTMKKSTFAYIVLICTLVIANNCVKGTTITYNSLFTVTSDSIVNYGDTIILNAGISISDNKTFTNNGVVICGNDLTVLTGNFINGSTGILNIDGYDMLVTSPTPTWPNGCHFVNDGAININDGDFSLYPSDNPYNQTIGVSFENNGAMILTDCEFTIRNNGKAWASFVNSSGSNVLIDNLTSGKGIHFGLASSDGIIMCEPDDPLRASSPVTSIFIEGGSEFHIKNTDLDINMLYSTPNYIKGNIIIDDGNLYIRNAYGGGGTVFTIDLPLGGIFISDTDDSGDDGLLSVSAGGGNTTLNVEGILYTEGIITEAGGGGNNIIVGDGGFAFVGNLGASMVDQFTLTVESGGTLNYCGNVIKDFADNVGTIEIGGTLNYAQSFYTDDPLTEADFSVDGDMYPLYTDSAECVAAFTTGVLGSGSLPIKLLYIKCNMDNNVIKLYWGTASEYNNNYFLIQESCDGSSWEDVGFENGNGNSSYEIQYTYTLYEYPNCIILYYRLKQVDYDGHYSYSTIASLYNKEYDGNAEITCYNMLGNQVELDFNYLSSGIYFIYVKVDNTIIKVDKLIIQ